MASYNNNIAGRGGASDGDMTGSGGLDSILAQLRRQSNQESPTSQQTPDLLSHFHPYHHQGNQPYFNQHPPDSPMEEAYQSSLDLPPAPTPPAGPGMFGASQPPTMLLRAAQNNADRTANLLNLLKFSGGQGAQSGLSQSTSTQAQEEESSPREPLVRHASGNTAPNMIHAPAPAAADPSGLLAALMKGHLQPEPAPKPEPQAVTSTWSSSAPSENTQQYLLNLLNRPKPSQSDAVSSEATKPMTLTPQSTAESVNDHLKEYPSLERALAEARKDPPPSVPSVPSVPTSSFDFQPKDSGSPQMKFELSSHSSRGGTPSKSNMFSYNNPFDDLAASSPLNQTPKSSTTPAGTSAVGQAVAVPIQILKKPVASHLPQNVPGDKRLGSSRSPIDSPKHTRRKLDATTSHAGDDGIVRHTPPQDEPTDDDYAHEKAKETVAEAVSDLAAKADRQAKEAVARAEQEQVQAKIAREIEDMVTAQSEQEFEESAHAAAQDIKKELDREENQEVLESTLQPDIAKAVRDIVDEAAQGPVADSWESAEADEIVVIEETTSPVKVYNFPMKPWISISLQEMDKENDIRPVFRDEAILDIARLKKDFDQMDRNLVAASESYMAYGMSKAGGLRVIRQDDGRDAKLFTDTKDRIFNLAISSTPPDQNLPHKEGIIGTGISGTVYWVQIKDGDKDHLEDTHPEQYGFALPPVSSHEGDAPGGVLKTRARASTVHPEFFAVGRGKTINIIWPSFILQNNLIKPGHDRVVDTEKLAKECSLKINTGKAGKDFTFSQDDTVVVSLDKSGRVKFWDVRDLTAAKEGSELHNPMPAQTSLEVKEPLLTLTTTPEGEKAWPTSVLLLDKFRPYQKRGALRYMIVGMKQNHTLQLWDLALGKPVQEFNLPHSKESDAVCSVAYHPASGMIVVGHPTRNSIYFLHLSAPKYTMKNLSQVDYIQRLVAQDSSIPQPESTAVISGMREYSFANKGVLRSLHLLQNPSSSSDSDEPTLFELYAMHSKGVACIMIKQAELGWTKDNKVMAPVDAEKAGVVKITKLKTPPPAVHPTESHGVSAETPSQIRLAIRSKDKENVLSASQEDVTISARKVADRSTSPTKSKEPKEEDTAPAQPPATPAEKPEKKSRKKKAAAAAAAAAAAQAESNGSSNSPRVAPVTPRKDAERISLASQGSSSFSQEAIESRINTMENRITLNLGKAFRGEIDDLRKKMDEDLRGRDAIFEKRQGQLLEMVSQVLNDNTQLVLTKIIHEEFEASVSPVIRDLVTKAVADQLSGKFNSAISSSVQKEMQKLLPNAISQALQKPDVAKSMTDRVVPSMVRQVDEQLVKVLNSQIIPAFTSVATQAAQRVGNDVHRQASEEIARLERIQRADSNKIDQLVALTTRLSDTISTMASAQSQFQGEFLKFQAQAMQPPQPQPQPHVPRSIGHGSQGSGAFNSPQAHSTHMTVGPTSSISQAPSQPQPSNYGPPPSQVVHQPMTKENRERLEMEQAIDDIDAAMANGLYEEAMMKWLQSGSRKEEEIFKRCLIKYNPAFVRELNPLLLLSVAATISADIEGALLREKLAWIELVLITFSNLMSTTDNQVREVTPKIMGIIKSRLESLFMRITNAAPGDPILKNLASMIQLTNRINSDVQMLGGSHPSPY
ncbi:Muc1 extracellular alpha--glucan glucosidase [Pleurostoma richardsiae]|uniref:Muc1 extracellular alpha--glucan glucosidase n=1 Tax=Pleurostoma richardsiae TaxID=41990 RepID=A0AA38RKD5_9PEZI|nr:Muc1 extracellular alpha--glucan glucosidase [Pleurostoma richardsiae]